MGPLSDHPLMLDMEVIVRRQDQERCASITSISSIMWPEGRR
jgi:hypothetical protein